MNKPVTRRANGQPVGDIVTEFRVVLPRLDMMRLHLAFRGAARLASASIAINHLLRPNSVLAVTPRDFVSGPLIVGWTEITQSTFVGAGLAAEFLFFECCDWLTRLDRKNRTAIRAGLFSISALPARICLACPVLGTPSAATRIRAEFEGLGPCGDHPLFHSTFLAGYDH
jgi:hypothetical protein